MVEVAKEARWAKVFEVMAAARCVVFDRRSPSACGLGPKHPKCMVVALSDAGYDIAKRAVVHDPGIVDRLHFVMHYGWSEACQRADKSIVDDGSQRSPNRAECVMYQRSQAVVVALGDHAETEVGWRERQMEELITRQAK